MVVKLYRKIQAYLKYLIHKYKFGRLDKLWRNGEKYHNLSGKNAGLRILFGPSFCLFGYSYVHDVLFSLALYLRNAEIIPIYCDGIQKQACCFYGGVWQDGYKESRENLCSDCQKKSLQLWSHTACKPLPLSQFIAEDDYQNIKQHIEKLSMPEVLSYERNGINFGQYVSDIARNNENIGNIELLKDKNICRVHLINFLLLEKAYLNIFDSNKIDRVFTNDTFYGMWGILQDIAKQKNIAVYSSWPVDKYSVCYNYNSPSMIRDFSVSWPAFSALSLSPEDNKNLDNLLLRQEKGSDSLINTAVIGKHQTDEISIDNFVSNSTPIALLCTNAIWDLAALNKSIVFEDMIQWTIKTIFWFSKNSEYKLIVKPHPAEKNPEIPQTQEQVVSQVLSYISPLPSNVLLLEPTSRIRVYDLYPYVQLGLVFTSSVGPEMAIRGIPCITVASSPYRGKGFTIDPTTENDYFEQLEKALKGHIPIEQDKQLDLAKKYYLFLQKHVYLKMNLMEPYGTWQAYPKIKKTNELLPGKNKQFDYVVDMIVKGEPIYQKDKWP